MSQSVAGACQEEDRWARECAALLAGQPFPACQDEMMATLIRRHAPSRLLRALTGLNRSHLYADVEEVLAACTAEHHPGRPSSPDGEPFRRGGGRP